MCERGSAATRAIAYRSTTSGRFRGEGPTRRPISESCAGRITPIGLPPVGRVSIHLDSGDAVSKAPKLGKYTAGFAGFAQAVEIGPVAEEGVEAAGGVDKPATAPEEVQ